MDDGQVHQICPHCSIHEVAVAYCCLSLIIMMKRCILAASRNYPPNMTTRDMFYTHKYVLHIVLTSKEPVCPRVELIFKIIIILLIIFLGFNKSKPC